MKIKLGHLQLFTLLSEHLIILVSIIVLSDVFLQVVPVWIFFVLIFILHGLFLNKYENAFIFILYSPILAGAFFKSLNISGLGGFFIPLGLLLIWKDIIKHSGALLKNFIPLLFIFIWFAFSAFLNSGGDYYAVKLINTIVCGSTSLIAFSILFINRTESKFSKLALILLMWSIFLLRLVIEINNIPGPSSLMQFGFMRDQTNPYATDALVGLEDFTISYHLPGFIALMGLTIYLTDIQIHNYKLNLLIWCLSLIVIFYSGARQNLVAFIGILMFYISTLREYSGLKKTLIIILFGITIAITLFAIQSDSIKEILEAKSIEAAADATGRSFRMGRGMELFNSSPVFGVGFGHYDYMGNYERFPHNMVVELLAELGYVGLLFILGLMIHSIIKLRGLLSKLQKNNLKPYLIILPLIIRAMVSGSMTTNVIIISFLLSLTFFECNTQKCDARYERKH